MTSLSTKTLQKATRKVVASLFDSSPTLWNHFYSEKARNIDVKTVAKAFASGGDCKYSLQLKDMGIGHEGEGILYVYKAYKLPNDEYVSAYGRFE
jgi:hypothetical protein